MISPQRENPYLSYGALGRNYSGLNKTPLNNSRMINPLNQSMSSHQILTPKLNNSNRAAQSCTRFY
jgi:hypothetical protein